MKILYSEKLNMDLKSILDFISEDSKKNAKQFAKDLREIINQIPPFLYKYRQSILIIFQLEIICLKDM